MPEGRNSHRCRCAQRYLKGVLANERVIRSLEEEVSLHQGRLFLSGVPGGEVQRKAVEGASQDQGFLALYDLCERLDTELCELAATREEALAVLAHIAGSPAYEVLHMRYFKAMPFRRIRAQLCMSERSVFRLHARGLHDLYPFIPAEFRQRREAGKEGGGDARRVL
ncbi:MAG: hypothetical protein LBG81_05735 [Coriobacteriaceae bacterium]|jgi:hypothetical protein|nr:hypothetical protein [Coriobacteriaceae bacterium]